VDAATGELRSAARHVLGLDWTGELKEEVKESTVEIGTPVCASVAGCEQELRRLRLQAATAAAARELAIVSAGIHPFSSWRGQALTSRERYIRIQERYGRLMRTQHIFGMHVHVGVPEGVDRVALLNRLRLYTPYLIALSASSPVYEGEDTAFASYRTVLFHRFPHTGPPPAFASEREYRAYVGRLVRARAIDDEWNIYWSIRLHPRYPTLEFRAADACPRIEDAVGVAALARALVAAAAAGRLPVTPAATGDSSADELLRTNEWTAARYGLEASLLDDPVPGGGHLRDSVLRLLDRVAPFAAALGDAAELAHVARILERGAGAERIRAQVGAGSELPEVVRWLAAETVLGLGLDRRSEQRE
jgi:carboxylate-amine ligase